MASIPNSPENLRILSLDGGGIKGYTSLLILRRIMRTFSQKQKDVRSNTRPCDVFDLIIGTSTGGLIAVMLGRLGMTVDECMTAYEHVGKRIFSKSAALGVVGKLVKGATSSSLYKVERLQEEIRSILKERGIPADSPFRVEGTAPCKVMLCVTRTATAKPEVLRNYFSGAATVENYDCTIWEAASATSAAPIYFKPVRFTAGGHEFSDGGLSRNNPVNEAIAELGRLPAWKGKKIGCLVSIGTGSTKITSLSTNLASFLMKAVEMLTDSERIADDFALSQIGQDLSAEDRYFRFNVPQGLEDLKLDEYKATERMEALTTFYLSKAGSGRDVERCAVSLFDPDRSTDSKIEQIPSMLPRQVHEHFVDRPLYTEKLQNFFHKESTASQIFVLWGMGGAGKSQIALNFGNLSKAFMPVFWIQANNLTTFAYDYRALFNRLSCDFEQPEDRPMIESLDRTRRSLERLNSKYLLILDNADNLDDFLNITDDAASIHKYIPNACRMLLTTRDPRFLGGYTASCNGIQVKSMSGVEAAQLLFKSVPRHLTHSAITEYSEDVQALLETLGHLPLAVAQAAANICDQQLSVLQYSIAYRDKARRLALMKIPVRDPNHSHPSLSTQSILVSWEMSFDVLAAGDPLSAICLNYMAFFNNRCIPHRILMSLPEFVNMGPEEEQVVISRLLKLSMIDEVSTRATHREYDLHPVVRERILERLNIEDSRRYGERVASLLRAIFPEPDSGSDLTSTCSYVAGYMLPHNLSCIQAGVSIELHCVQLGILMQLTAGFLNQRGFISLALELATRSFNEAILVWPESDFNVFQILTTKMHCLSRSEQFDEVLWNCDFIGDQILSSDAARSQVSETELDQGWMQLLEFRSFALFELGRYTEQLFLSQIQVRLHDVMAPMDSNGSTRYTHNIANLLNHLGRTDEAEILCDKQLQDLESSRGTDISSHPNVLILREKVTCLMHRWNTEHPKALPTSSRYLQNALPYSRRACQIAMTLGPTHPGLWSAAGETLMLLHQLQLVDEVLKTATEVLQLLDEERPYIEGMMLRKVVTFLSYVYDTINRPVFSEHPAAERLASLLHLLSREYDIDFTQTGYMTRSPVARLNAQGIELTSSGRNVEAESAFRKALRLTPQHEQSSWSILHYNIMLSMGRQAGRFEEALEYRLLRQSIIQAEEHTYGSLEARLAGDEADRIVYRRALNEKTQSRGMTASYTYAEAASLARATKRYGPIEKCLIPPEPLEGVATSTPRQTQVRKRIFRAIKAKM